MPYIQYEGKKYEFATLKESIVRAHPAFTFCHYWLNGQKRFMLKTSGSTGQPKAIEIVRWQMEASIAGTASTLKLNESDNALICINTAYIGGMMMLARTLALGMNALILPPEGNPLARVPEDFQPTFIALVPLQLGKALKEEKSTKVLEGCKAVIVGGAPVTLKLEAKLQRLNAPLYSTYGMTETVSHVALRRLNGPSRSEEYRLINGIEIAQDERGCLRLLGEVTAGKWLQTNDQVHINPNKESFQWLGRADQTINSGGIKVSIAQVERVAEKWIQQQQLPWLAVALGIPDQSLGERVVLALALENPEQVGENNQEWQQQLMQHLKEELPSYHAPKEICWVEHIPQTPTQKPDRKALAQQLLGD